MSRTASGWSDDHEFTTTFATLKRSMAEAAEAERERIIALLEEHRVVGYAEEMTHDALIALIKGEKE